MFTDLEEFEEFDATPVYAPSVTKTEIALGGAPKKSKGRIFELTVRTGPKVSTFTTLCMEPTSNADFARYAVAKFGKERVIKISNK